MDTSELLTTREVAERLDTTTSTVNRWVNAGKLAPTVNFPGQTGARLFDPKSVDAFKLRLAS